MPLGRPVVAIVLSCEERAYLTHQSVRRSVRADFKQRCEIILACADGLSNKAASEKVGIGVHSVGKWRRRFAGHRIDGLYDEPRPGGPR